MALIDVLRIDDIKVNVDVRNKKQLIHEIAQIACSNPALHGVALEDVEKALEERETLGSTGLGSGVAVPHCRLKGINGFVVGLITTKKSIDFDSIDNAKVNVFPFVIGPDENPKEHLKILSGMARLLRNPDTRSHARQSSSAAELYTFLRNLLKDVSPATPQPQFCSMKMLHVFIRSEELFNDILQVFASGDQTGAVVLEAHESTEYMSSMPVFAGLWNNDLNTFNRIIVAVVQDTLLNQTLRSLEYVCGDLRSQTEVMVTVTDLHHALGSLDY